MRLVWALIMHFQIGEYSHIMVIENVMKRWKWYVYKDSTIFYSKGIFYYSYGNSWHDGVAFCALVAQLVPDKIDFNKISEKNKLQNLNLAFHIAETKLVCIPTTFEISQLENKIQL
jgi:hypothetical protein